MIRRFGEHSLIGNANVQFRNFPILQNVTIADCSLFFLSEGGFFSQAHVMEGTLRKDHRFASKLREISDTCRGQ